MKWILIVCLLFTHALWADSTTSRKIVKKSSGIILDEGNFVFLKGAINRQVVSKFMNEFLRLDHRSVNYIFINSPGSLTSFVANLEIRDSKICSIFGKP